MNSGEINSFANIAQIVRSSQEFLPAHVIFAGAGEGNLANVSLAVISAVMQADAIFHDTHAPAQLLALAQKGARLVPCGKVAGLVSPRQQTISAHLRAAALNGERVLRLKGGDPTIFSRLGEELAELEDAGIACTILPGVSSFQAAAAKAGIPLSHREINQQITLVTGRDRTGKLSANLDFNHLARKKDTLVLFMANGFFEEIAKKLIASGAEPERPLAVFERLALKGERLRFTTLGNLNSLGKIATPTLFILGEVVRLAPLFDKQLSSNQQKTLQRDLA